jgi:deoxyribodipyrimidine photolyase
MDVAIVVFTRDLRVHDNPALATAVARARQVVPLFVVDPALAVPPNRARFLADSLKALRAGLRDRGGDLVIRRGDPVAEVITLATRTGAGAVFIAGDVSRYAARRQQRLNRECATHRIALEVTPGHAVVPPGDQTSRLSAYLRFGCVSPLVLAREALHRPEGAQFCRQLAWRDFFHQVTAAFPDIAAVDYRPGAAGPRQWSPGAGDLDALDAWRAGRTGIPIVDAGLRQLAAEGFMHNRARMITASFLTRTLGIDWRHGYRHFRDLLADGDVASNAGNWQWVAGTGNNPRPGRVLSPLRQAARFDRDGDYVRRYVPELASLAAPGIHAPWRLPEARRRQLRYPPPLIDVNISPRLSRR